MHFGRGEPKVAIRLTDHQAALALACDPLLKLGELYMDGRLVLEEGDVADLLALVTKNWAVAPPVQLPVRLLTAARRAVRRIRQFNPVSRSRANVVHHYDLSQELYRLFLDTDRQYSCAYFSEPGKSLEEAQLAKKRHIAAKLWLNRPGLKVLDIGCGWGGMALELARAANADVTGITLSEEQLVVARERAARSGMGERLRFDLVDYRTQRGNYDRIVSVGMFEHVGLPQYPAFFAKISTLLKNDGVMLLHYIGRAEGPGETNPWMAKYIFPGGYCPALSEVLPAIERAGLLVTDIEVLRLHYAQTLRAWRERFNASRARIAELYDERFCRMWEFYLAGSEMAFRHDSMVVHQIQIARRTDSLPITRDYMLENERALNQMSQARAVQAA
jgi:cyclopropane-fatty-acyl-phospholipid synthase